MPLLLGLMICVSFSLAGYSDGYITAGEYEEWVEWTCADPPLIIDGGGSNWIEMRNFGRLEVRSTSTPINNNFDTGGIWDISLDDYSELVYLGGITEEITICENAFAILKGGRIVAITSMQNATTQHIDLYCQPGWSWLYEDEDLDGFDEIVGITGLWKDGTTFKNEFINDEDYDPVYMNINVIPERASLALLGLGGVFVRPRTLRR